MKILESTCYCIYAVKQKVKGPPAKGLLEIRHRHRQKHSASRVRDSDEEWILPKRK